ncbi:MAG: hypothetical protein PHC85_01930 [Candidatus Pacebacteria bacterium]|nr:hypothetical protein [Candidatus Paceibacterota bacterium]
MPYFELILCRASGEKRAKDLIIQGIPAESENVLRAFFQRVRKKGGFNRKRIKEIHPFSDEEK